MLHDITLEIPAGSHIAIIGPSGAGKSSLAGLLLGWRTAASGALLIDHAPLTPERHESIRRETAWIDPTVQIWNRSVLENFRFGLTGAPAMNIGDVVDEIDFTSVLERLPDGLQTVVGEGGTLVSGGEGQRVRVGRALARREARLVIMDEPFRGLDADARRNLLRRARKIWSKATLLFVTHDVAEAQNFDRVLVLDAGTIVEDGAPSDLSQRPASRYRALLDEEARLKRRWISGSQWRHLEMDRGTLREHEHDSLPHAVEKPKVDQSAKERIA